MLTISNRWLETIESDDRKCRGYITLDNTEISDDLFQYKLTETVYDDDFIGTFHKNRCDIEVLNKQRIYSFDNKRVKVYAGLQYDDLSEEYILLGTFIVSNAPYDDVNSLSTLECYDLSTLFDVPYKTQSTFPCTIRTYVGDICKAIGINLSTDSFNLDTLTLVTEPYVESDGTYRDAIKSICQMCLSNAQIINDELVIKAVKRDEVNFKLEDYFELTSEPTVGPYNVLTLSRTPQEDNYVYPQTLPENPIEYRIENNVIIDSNRETYAPVLYQYINGLTFTPCSITLLKGRPEITPLDYFTYLDMEDNKSQSIVFTHELLFDGNFSSTIYCTRKSQTETNYKRAGTITKKIQQTELWVDKANGQIESLIKDMYSENGVVNESFSKIEQTIKNIVFSVQTSGGNNMLLNSVGFAGLESWESTGDNIETTSSVDIQQNSTSGGGFVLNSSSIKQKITVKLNSATTTNKQQYSFSCKVKKGADSKGYIKIYNDNENYIVTLDESIQNYDEFSIQGMTPTMNYYYVELISEHGSILFTDNMFNIGNLTTTWSQANGEILNTQVNITNNGIVVKSLQFDNNGQYTVISPLEFSGYANVKGVQTRVFTLNGETTEVEAIKIRSTIDMEPIKIVPITGQTKNGWAIVPDGSEN